MSVPWAAVLYLLVVSLFILTLVPALRELRMRRDAKPLQVVRQHDTNIRHFAYSFRSQLQTLFAKYHIDPLRPPASFEGFWKEDERFQFVGIGEDFQPDAAESRSGVVKRLIVGAGGLRLPDDNVFEQEVFAIGPIHCGNATTLRAIFSDADVVLGNDCSVARWIHADRKVEVASGSKVFGRCSANTKIVLQSGTQFERLSAPLIRTGHSEIAAPPMLTGRQHYEIPRSAMELDEHTSLVNGTIAVPERSAVTRNLIASDSVEIGSQCLVDGSLKGHRLVRLAAGCIVRGAIVSGSDIEIGPDCIIAGPLIAEGRITIASGCVVGTRALETSVSAPNVSLASGSRFSGTVWATKVGRVS